MVVWVISVIAVDIAVVIEAGIEVDIAVVIAADIAVDSHSIGVSTSKKTNNEIIK